MPRAPPAAARAEKGEGAAELLAARGFALLLMLAECEAPPFMDQVGVHEPLGTQRVYGGEVQPSAQHTLLAVHCPHAQVAQHASTRRLADHVNNRAAAYIGQVLLRPSTAHFPAAPGESQMAINTLRAAELLSDDSNFRAGLIPLLAPTAAHLLSSGGHGCGGGGMTEVAGAWATAVCGAVWGSVGQCGAGWASVGQLI